MSIEVKKYGTAYKVRIPAQIVDSLKWTDGEALFWGIVNSLIVLGKGGQGKSFPLKKHGKQIYLITIPGKLVQAVGLKMYELRIMDGYLIFDKETENE